VILELGCRFDLKEIFIIGSSAILAVLPDPPVGELTASRDVDVIAPADEERLADQISYVLGEGSDFDKDYGYYADGVTSGTPSYAPRDWKTRTLPVRVQDVIGHCMAPDDLVLSKRGVGREKDLDFSKSVAKLQLVKQEALLERLVLVNCGEDHRKLIEARVRALFADNQGP
jgi:hypothetical protein